MRRWIKVQCFGIVAQGLVAFALPAQADAPSGRYTITAGTVFDNKTGLTWQQTEAASGGDDGKGNYQWLNGQKSCTALGAKWRLPTVKDLLTIVDFAKAASPPLIDTGTFLGATADPFWTATPILGDSGNSYYIVDFGGNLVSLVSASSMHRVRCVR
jgi:hypothetical protein